MPRNRIIYQSEAVYAGPAPATGYHYGTYTPGIGGNSNVPEVSTNLVKQLQRIQTANYSFTVDRTDVNQFGQLAAIDRVILTNPTVSLDFSYINSNLSNENIITVVLYFVINFFIFLIAFSIYKKFTIIEGNILKQVEKGVNKGIKDTKKAVNKTVDKTKEAAEAAEAAAKKVKDEAEAAEAAAKKAADEAEAAAQKAKDEAAATKKRLEEEAKIANQKSHHRKQKALELLLSLMKD